MNSAGFAIYILFIVSWFLHLTARLPALSIVRTDFVLASVLIILKIITRSNKSRLDISSCTKNLNYLLLSILIMTPFAEYPGSVIRYGIPNLLKAIAFYYFTIWFVDTKNKLYALISTFLLCQSIRVIEPLYLHITQGYWGSKASLSGWGSMDRLAGAPTDIVNPNGLAYVVLTIMPFIISYYNISMKWKITTIILMPIAVYVVTLTGSRSGIIGMAFTITYLLYKSTNKIKYIIMSLLGAVLVISSMTDIQLDRYKSIYDTNTRNSTTAEGRYLGTLKHLETVKRYPLFGSGLGTSMEVNANVLGSAQITHNIFIEVIQETGFVGFTMFTLFIISIFKTLLINNNTSIENAEHKMILTNNAVFALALTTLLSGVFSYGLSSYEWYFIGGATASIEKLMHSKTI